MKSSETDILIIPGYDGSDPGHWQHRLAQKLSSARIVEQPDWKMPSLTEAVVQIVKALQHPHSKPVVFITHSAGGNLVAHAMQMIKEQALKDKVKGAFLVTPPCDEALSKLQGLDPAFLPTPRDPLPFPSALVASSDDPFATLEQSADLALAWGSQFVEAGPAGHINMASGHGPWPEGMMRFAGFLSKLQ